MKLKKFVKFNLIFIILIGIVWCVCCNISIGLSSDDTDAFIEYAKKSYDYAVSRINSSSDGYGLLHVSGTFSNQAYNIPCMHLSQNSNTSKSGYQELLGYVMISSDGTASVYSYNANTGKSTLTDTISNRQAEFQNTARMCYYVTESDGGASYYENSSYFTGKKIGTGDTSGTWMQLIGWYNQYASTFKWSTTWTSMLDRANITLSTSSGPWALAVANPENITCEAIILYYAPHGQQAAIMCLGKVSDATPTINKYITSTTNSGSISGRSDMTDGTDGTKYANAVEVAPGETVTFAITVTNTYSQEKTFRILDTFESACFSYSSDSDNTTQGWKTVSGSNDVYCDVTVAAGGSVTKYLNLIVSTENGGTSGTKYLNRADLYEGSELITQSWDYVKLVIIIDGTIDKYIYKTEDSTGKTSTISNRKNQTDEYKSSNAVSAEFDDIIYYEIVVTNTGNVDTVFTVRDQFDATLSIDEDEIDVSSSDFINDSTYSFYLKEAEVEENVTYDSEYNVEIFSIPLKVNGTCTIKIALNVSTDSTESLIDNNACLYVDSDLLAKSSDYISMGDEDGTINKYISSVSNNSIDLDDRSGYSESEKENNPVSAGTVTSCTITYTIELTSLEVGTTYTLYDEFDSALSYSSSSSSGWTRDSATKYHRTVTPDKNGNASYTITLKYTYSTTNSGGIFENKAYIGDSSSSDYIEFYNQVKRTSSNYKKYITKIVKADGKTTYEFDSEDYNDSDYSSDSRETLTESSKKANPVIVEEGDLVYFTVSIKLSGHWCECTITDKIGEGLEMVTSEFKYECSSSRYSEWIKKVDVSTSGFTYSSNCGKDECRSDSNCLKSTTTYTFTYCCKVTDTELSTNLCTNTCKITGEKKGVHHYRSCSKHGQHPVYYHHMKTVSYTTSDYVALVTPEIAGTVWLDSNEDGTMNDGNNSGIKDVYVTLYDKSSGTAVETIKTDGNGNFSFGRIPKASGGSTSLWTTIDSSEKYYNYYFTGSYKTYYLEYTYFGVQYESTDYTDGTGVANMSSSNAWMSKSHAQEYTSDRESFNSRFTTIAYNQAYSDTSGSSTYNKGTLSYSKDGHVSTLNWGGTKSDVTSINAYSFDLYVSPAHDSKVAYLQHMNLGLKEREQTNLELTKDVVSSYTTINSMKTTYTYENLGTRNYTGDNYLSTPYSYEDGDYYLSTPYELWIYNEDYRYRSSSYSDEILQNLKEGTELEVTLTYKITITNESEFYNVIREVVDISSNEMTLIRAYGYNAAGEVVSYNKSEDSAYNNKSNYNYSNYGYNTWFITGFDNVVLGSGETLEIYLEYTVNKDSNDSIIVDSSNDSGKVNIAQISAFSTYDDKSLKSPSGVVDANSNPGNIVEYDNETDFDNYEDDTFYTTILILLRDETDGLRTISGNVWEDLETETNSKGQNYGDGLRDESENENGANNVTVKLMEVIDITDSSGNTSEYLVDTGISTKTDTNGNYTLKNIDNLHAGTYIVRFIYGDNANDLAGTGNTIKYSGQDYKSTTYTNVGTTDDETEIVETTAFSEAKTNAGQEISVARDNELRRLEVISYSTTMDYTLDSILKADDNDEKKTLAENTGMYADTLKFNVQIEYFDNYTGNTKEEKSNFKISGLDKYEYKVQDVDFGLIERPSTKLELMNDMTEMIATSSTGTELVHLYFDIEYSFNGGNLSHTSKLNEEKSVGNENVQSLNRGNGGSNGFRYVNIDTMYMQGMTVTVKYQISIANISDIDTSSENLVWMAKNGEVKEVAEYLKSYTSFGETGKTYSYNASHDTTKVSNNMLSSYSYTELKRAIEKLHQEQYDDYATKDTYEYGYFLGKTYYAVRTKETTDTSTYTLEVDSKDVIVETRVDQIVDYVDPDLVFTMLDNVNESGSPRYVIYTISEIASRGLLAKVTGSIEKITDGSESYIDTEENSEKNIVFSAESNSINPELYQYLKPLNANYNNSNNKIKEADLYVIDIQASKVLSSENDDFVAENISEIIKISNTVGRKIYVEAGEVTGYIGNSTSTVDDKEIIVNVDTVSETDTDYSEGTQISGPTGLSIMEQKEYTIVRIIAIVIASLACVCAILIIIKIIKKRKKVYR